MIPNLIVWLSLVAIGFIILIKSSDIFIDKVTLVAKSLGISEFIIGLTVVALGTSFPELVSSIMSVLKGLPELAMGSLLGSNIANIALILGVSGMINILEIENKIIKRDGYMMIFSFLLFYLFAATLEITRPESFILIFIYLCYVLFLFKEKSVFEKDYFNDFLHFSLNLKFLGNKKEKRYSYSKKKIDLKSLVIGIICLLGVILGASIVINNSIKVSDHLGISQGFVGLTVIALGTSLPELSIAISASKKGHGEISLGNVFGSNIANTLLILGIASFIRPYSLNLLTKLFIIPFMILISVLLVLFIHKENRLVKWQSRLFLFLYACFILTNFILSKII